MQKESLTFCMEAVNRTLKIDPVSPQGTITWETRNSQSTIDLIFMSSEMANKIEHCKARPEINQSSDHIPVSTKILLGTVTAPIVPRRL